jgi:hypothetical protein
MRSGGSTRLRSVPDDDSGRKFREQNDESVGLPATCCAARWCDRLAQGHELGLTRINGLLKA